MRNMKWQIVDGSGSEGWISWESLSQNVKVGICSSINIKSRHSAGHKGFWYSGGL